MRARDLLLLMLLASLPPAAAGADGKAAPPPYRLVVHPGTPATSVDRAFVADVFLKKATRWPDDTVIRPVDGAASSAIRRRFSEDVLKRSVNAVQSYWQQVIFSGRGVPPPELDSDADIVSYVQKHPGAIGYVSPDVDPAGVKVLQLR